MAAARALLAAVLCEGPETSSTGSSTAESQKGLKRLAYELSLGVFQSRYAKSHSIWEGCFLWICFLTECARAWNKGRKEGPGRMMIDP